MRAQALHAWDLSPTQAIAWQKARRGRVVVRNELDKVRDVAGVDVSTRSGRAHAAVVVLRFPELTPLHSVEADLPLTFPYVPGLLAFREIPAILAALEGLHGEPELFIVDGQGMAHPRRMGLASHLGVLLDRPTIGCAKSLLCGACDEVGPQVGDQTAIRDGDEVIGAALRTRASVRPVYVSIGHKVDLATAVNYVLRCSKGFRLPEPVRWAHRVAGGQSLPTVDSSREGIG